MPIYECADCGSVKVARKWPECEKSGRHDVRGMTMVVGWGKNGEPESLSQMRERTKLTSKTPIKK